VALFVAFGITACSSGGATPAASGFARDDAATARTIGAVHPLAAQNVVVNGGFETGSLSGWTSVGGTTGAPKITTAAHTGSYAAFMGTTKAPEVSGFVGLEQSVTVPAAGTLAFYVRGESDDTQTYAFEEVDLRNASGTVVDVCYKGLLDTTTWQAESCDVSAYAGQTLTLFLGISGNGYSSTYVDAWYDDVSLTGSGTASPTASPSASPTPTATPTPKPSASPTATAKPTASPTPTPKPSATPTASPTPKPTATPTAAPTGAYPVDPGPFSVVQESAFETIVTNGKNIRFSTYLLSPTSTLEAALVSAAKGGASVTVDLPSDSYVQSLGDVYQEDQESATNIQNAGGTVNWDAGTQTPAMPLHAKLAIIDGTAYLDGRNWDSGDVILSETGSADLTAIGNALALTPTDSAYLDTIKQDALALETTFIQNAKGTTVDYMTESFGAGNVEAALLAKAQAGATVHLIVLKSDTSQSEDTTLTQLKNAGVDVELNPGSGSEKMTIIGSAAWFGSSNSTTGSPDQIDWGAVFTSSSVLSTLQANFNSTLATCTKY
jgi:cell division septation protein DedD